MGQVIKSVFGELQIIMREPICLRACRKINPRGFCYFDGPFEAVSFGVG